MPARLEMTKLLTLLCVGCAAAAAGGWAGLAQAGVRIESKVTAYDNQPVDTVLELQGDAFRIDRGDSSTNPVPRTTIFDGEKMIVVNGRDKTYTEMTLADLKAKFDQMEQMKDSLPPEAKAQLERQTNAPAFTFKRADGGDMVAGVACDNYQIFKDGKESGVACLTGWKGSKLMSKTDLAPMKKLIDSMKSMSKLAAGDLEMAQFDKWPGWPLIMRAPDGHELSRVVKISRVQFPDKEFQAPAEYTPKSVPQMMGGTAAHP
jgi:hypothetical protein